MIMSGVQQDLLLSKQSLDLLRKLSLILWVQSIPTKQKKTNRTKFDGRVDVIPVSDPNASTMSQKMMQYKPLTVSPTAPHCMTWANCTDECLRFLAFQMRGNHQAS